MKASNSSAGVEVLRVAEGSSCSTRDIVAVEEPLEIRIGFERKGMKTSRSVSVTMRTPGDDAELAAGFLYGEGILNGRSDVEVIDVPDSDAPESSNRIRVQLRPGVSIDLKRLDRHFYTTSSCGVCGKASLEAVRRMTGNVRPGNADGLRVSAQVLHQMPIRLREEQAVFARTGGLHAAALFDAEGRLCSVREDVGRHNAVDKVIGAEWLAGRLPLSGRILFVSGRASFELVQKAVRAGIPMLAAVGAPSSLSVELAQTFGVTLIGFVRDGRFNVYTSAARICGASAEATVLP